MNNQINECEVIRKQQEYIAQLESKIQELTNSKVPMTWVQVRKIAEKRIEDMGLNIQRSYALWSGITSITSKALKKSTVTGLIGDDAERAYKVVEDILNVFEKYYREEDVNEPTNE